jgi:hypothetical protein
MQIVYRKLAVLPDTAQRFSSGTKYIRLANPVPYLEEEEEECFAQLT